MKRTRRYQKKSSSNISAAKDHIASLLEQAKMVSKDNIPLADRYVALARKIAMKFRVRLTPAQKRLFCPYCYRFMLPGRTCRVRVHDGKVIYYCLSCRKFWRKPLDQRSRSR